MKAAVSVILYLIFAPLLGGLLDGLDRKISARMQGRTGPSVLQPFYDVIKLFHKQSLMVYRPQFFLVVSYLFFVIFTGALFFAGCDLLMCFFALAAAAMFLVLASCSTHSPYSSMGSQRELIQMMSYEPMVLLTAVGFYLATGSFRTDEIVQSAVSPILYMPGFFIGFVYILTIKMRKSPFDLSTSHHAHQELVKGVTAELVGDLLAATTIAEWYENIFLLGVIALFFCNSSTPWSYVAAVIVCLFCYFLEILIDNTSARVKWNVVFASSWIVSFLAGGINLLVLDLVR